MTGTLITTTTLCKGHRQNPTNVECFDLSQSNSEHSRHWFFRGRLVIDGREMPDNLMKVVRQTLEANPGNSVIAFKDNSSAIKGYEIDTIIPVMPGNPSGFRRSRLFCNLIFTAETHNFPSGVATVSRCGDRNRRKDTDVQATGRDPLSWRYCRILCREPQNTGL